MESSMTDEVADSKPPRKKIADRWGKIAFAVVGLIVIVLLYWKQTSVPELKGWGKDLQAALRTARTDGRRVVVLFSRSTPSHTTRRLTQTTLVSEHNRIAIRDRKLLPVQVAVDGESADLAREYRIKVFPTVLLLGPSGWEYNRREGFIGDLDFRKGFLKCEVVQKAGVRGWRRATTPQDMRAIYDSAGKGKRKVLALFAADPPDKLTTELYRTTLADPATHRAVEELNPILVHIPVADLARSTLAERYRIRKLPTLLLLSHSDREERRRAETVPKGTFRTEFLGPPVKQP